MSFKKTLVGIVLTGVMSGCDEPSGVVKKNVAEGTREYSFDGFGRYNLIDAFDGVSAADFDGDGDQDIVFISSARDIYILENKMPQKKYENK